MSKDDTSLVALSDITTALALLTRLPVKAGFDRSRQSVWAYPVTGAAMAACAGVIVALALAVGIAPAFAAGLWIATTTVLTGAMHEDGLADCADGFWGGWDPVRRLEIMKDSQIGTYGVLALVLSIGVRWASVWMLIEAQQWFWPLLAFEVLSRSAMPAIMHALPHARDTGLSKSQGRPTLNGALTGIGLAVLVAFFCVGFAVAKLLILGALVTAGIGALAQRKIGGQTGDVLGATQQVCLIAMLMVSAG